MQNSEVVSALPSTTVKSTSIAGFGALVSVKIYWEWNSFVWKLHYGSWLNSLAISVSTLPMYIALKSNKHLRNIYFEFWKAAYKTQKDN